MQVSEYNWIGVQSIGFDMYGDVQAQLEREGRTEYARITPSGRTTFSENGGEVTEAIALDSIGENKTVKSKTTDKPDIRKAYEEYKQVEFYRRKGISHRKLNKNGQQIIDKPTYNLLTRDFIADGGLIIRGKDAENHLGEGNGASYLPSFNCAFIKNDATISEVLEEMYHAEQDKKNMFGKTATWEVILRREIDAQKYLIKVAGKYKIPIEETLLTVRNLKHYESELERLLREENA